MIGRRHNQRINLHHDNENPIGMKLSHNNMKNSGLKNNSNVIKKKGLGGKSRRALNDITNNKNDNTQTYKSQKKIMKHTLLEQVTKPKTNHHRKNKRQVTTLLAPPKHKIVEQKDEPVDDVEYIHGKSEVDPFDGGIDFKAVKNALPITTPVDLDDLLNTDDILDGLDDFDIDSLELPDLDLSCDDM